MCKSPQRPSLINLLTLVFGRPTAELGRCLQQAPWWRLRPEARYIELTSRLVRAPVGRAQQNSGYSRPHSPKLARRQRRMLINERRPNIDELELSDRLIAVAANPHPSSTEQDSKDRPRCCWPAKS